MIEKNITKHKNDVFRLYRVVDPTKEIDIPEAISKDMSAFLDAMEGEDVIPYDTSTAVSPNIFSEHYPK